MSSYALRENRDGNRRLMITIKRMSLHNVRKIKRSDFLIIMGLLDTFAIELYILNEPYDWISDWVRE